MAALWQFSQLPCLRRISVRIHHKYNICPLHQLQCAAVILLDEGDSVARSGVEGAVNYVTRNQLATVTATTVLEVQEEEPSSTADQGDTLVVTITTPASHCPQCGRGG